MAKPKPELQDTSKPKKGNNLATRGKNEAGQTGGQFEKDPKGRSGQYTAAGSAPRMKK
jgi:hypothetical protein